MRRVVESRWFKIRPISNSDLEWGHELALSQPNCETSRWRNFYGPIERFGEFFFGGAHEVAVVERLSGERIGVVMTHDYDSQNLVCALSTLCRPSSIGKGSVLMAAAGFVDLTFSRWPVRKIYIQTTDTSLARMKRGIRLAADLEATLVEHVIVDGGTIDQQIWAIHRDAWDTDVRPTLVRLGVRSA